MAVPPVLLFTVFLNHWYFRVPVPVLVAVTLRAVGVASVAYTALTGCLSMVMPLTVTEIERSTSSATPSPSVSTEKVMLSSLPTSLGVITSSPVEGLNEALT